MIEVKYSALHYLIAMLKSYGIRHVVTSPGTQNAAFNLYIQEDGFFEVYSVVDERSAAYVATGIAYQTKEPVVVACTEATASRNYLSAMTEAYYRDLPIVACTFFNPSLNKYSMSPQFVDRSVIQNDVKAVSVELPQIHSMVDRNNCLTFLNKVLVTAKYQNKPVHINCPSLLEINDINEIKTLPVDIWGSQYYVDDFSDLKDELSDKKLCIFIGSHKKFSNTTIDAISKFAKGYNCPVICDYTSNYYGENRVLLSQLTRILTDELKPEIVIDLGSISADYTSNKILRGSEIWRVVNDENIKFRHNLPIKKIFNCSEKYFFETLMEQKIERFNYYGLIRNSVDGFELPQLPYSTPFIAQTLINNIPKNSSLHLGILNSFRCANYFDIDESIDVVSNVGGFGIDGILSTLFGQALVNKKNKCFGLLGDLAFFYDMNILGNRDLPSNLRIILVNNNKGIEFRVGYIGQIADKEKRIDSFVAAGGHYKSGAKQWVESCGFLYFAAKNKVELVELIDDFCNKEYDKPVLIECFTTNEDEEIGLDKLINGK